ncbi:MAG: hypothetical protein R3A46_06825 [Thermomicrobiales bacterium]
MRDRGSLGDDEIGSSNAQDLAGRLFDSSVMTPRATTVVMPMAMPSIVKPASTGWHQVQEDQREK